MSKVYDLSAGLEQAKTRIEEGQRKISRPFIVSVAGPSNSGKTTKVAAGIQNLFPGSERLSTDDYYRGKCFMDSICSKNWDDPGAADLDLVAEHIKILKRNIPVLKPVYSFKTGERTGYAIFKPTSLMLVEGIFALHETVAREADLKIFVEISVHGSLLRRLLRDVGRTGQKRQDIFKQIVDNVYPMYKLHVEPTKELADIIIKNEYAPAIEAECCEIKEIQIKASVGQGGTGIPWESLLALGFKKAEACYQEDTYYAAPHWQLPYTDELMRIRKEGDRYFVAYKGPSKSGPLRIRPKIEFEIEPFLKDAFLTLGYQKILVIKKQRTKMLGQNSELAVDEIEGDGDFLEFRIADPNSQSQITDYFKQLGVDEKSITQKSYLELMLERRMNNG